jgi:hypothetical protein
MLGSGGPGLGRAKVGVGPGSGDPCSSFLVLPLLTALTSATLVGGI